MFLMDYASTTLPHAGLNALSHSTRAAEEDGVIFAGIRYQGSEKTVEVILYSLPSGSSFSSLSDLVLVMLSICAFKL